MIRDLSFQIPKAFHHHGIVERTMIEVKGFDVANYIANLYWK